MIMIMDIVGVVVKVGTIIHHLITPIPIPIPEIMTCRGVVLPPYLQREITITDLLKDRLVRCP